MKVRAFLALAIIAVTCSVSSVAHAEKSLSVGIVYDIGGVGDRSYNDAALAGLKLAQKKFSFTVTSVVTDGTSTDRYNRISKLIENKCNPVILVGPGFSQAVMGLSIEYPETEFAILNDASVSALNVHSLIFNEKQGAYIAGYAAALSSKTGKIAMIATANQADLYQDGFVAGAQAGKKSIKTSVKYVSGSATSAGKSLMTSGADVIFMARPGSNADIFTAITSRNGAAAKKSKYYPVRLISQDPDQYVTVSSTTKKYLLASVVKRVDIAIYDIISNAVAGRADLDVLDSVAGIYGRRYDLARGIELRIFDPSLSKLSGTIDKAASSASRIAN